MNSDQFQALAQLLRLRQGPQREAARLVRWWMACDKLTRHAWRGAVLLHWATRCAHAALGWGLRAWQLELIEHA